MSKLLPLDQVIARYVPDGSSVALGMALESLIPFAAGFSLIRLNRRDLELIGPISDVLFDILIGAGCVRRVTAAWIGNVSAGLGHNYRRAVERGIPRRIELEEHSNISVGLGLQAAAMGVPYLPTRTLVGSDLALNHPRLRPVDSGLLHVLPIEPDLAILHVQRADVEGHAHCWGNLGLSKEAGLAARRVLLVAEEIVDTQVILSDPNRVFLPAHRVTAVAHVPGGAHPSSVQGVYGRDHAFFAEYHTSSRERDDFLAWLDAWVLQVPSHDRYLEKLGMHFEGLRPVEQHLAAPVDYA